MLKTIGADTIFNDYDHRSNRKSQWCNDKLSPGNVEAR